MGQITATYIDHMGHDLSVVRAARVSFADDPNVGLDCPEGDNCCNMPGCYGTFRDKDADLIRYLSKHDHFTPFTHTAITLRVSAPVPIRTQCFKHKVGFSENEESRRYIKSTPVLYVPEVWRKAPPEGGAKQGSGGDFDHKMKFTYINGEYDFLDVGQVYCDATSASLNAYEQMVEAGVCPEQARFVLPQGCLVNWYWTGSLAAYARFYQQRTDPHAQKEIQDLAKVIGGIIEPLFPVAWKELTK